MGGVALPLARFMFFHTLAYPYPPSGDVFLPENQPPDNFTGLWVIRYPGSARCEREYVNGSADGSYRYVLNNGVCTRESSLKNGQWHGTMIIRSSEGTVLDASEFDEGSGVYRLFSSDGWSNQRREERQRATQMTEGRVVLNT